VELKVPVPVVMLPGVTVAVCVVPGVPVLPGVVATDEVKIDVTVVPAVRVVA